MPTRHPHRPVRVNGLSAPAGTGTGRRRDGSSQLRPQLRGSRPQLRGSPPGLKRQDGCCISGLGGGSGSTCSHLPPLSPPPPTDGWDAGVRRPVGCSVLCRAVPHRAKRQNPGLKAQHRAISPCTRAEGCGAELNLAPHPRVPPGARCSSPGAGQTPPEGPWGGKWVKGGAEEMELLSSRSRPLVSRMSRRCHTHLMWFLAGAAAALSRG